MIIGRKKEQQILNRAFSSNQPQFIAIYGRRRVGKTYLIKQLFSSKKCIFLHATGVYKDKLKSQLNKFTQSLSQAFFNNAPLTTPPSWDQAFTLLNQQIEKTSEKVVIFLDELPWMATNKSGLLEAIDYYWNHYWSHLPNVMLIVCGSSASWILRKIIYNKGGLHNRITTEMRLDPFTLNETHAYLKYRKINLNKKHTFSIYMALGGVPHYLNYLDPGLSAEQNIQRIFFDTSAPLKDEFTKLFRSLFSSANAYIELVHILANKKSGVSRTELEKQAKLTGAGGRLTSRLDDLCTAGFVEKYQVWGQKIGEYFKLIDEFCLFYLYWIESEKSKRFTKTHWHNQCSKPKYNVWAGYSFECICMKHIAQVLAAISMTGGGTISSWRYIPKNSNETGAQIDLLVDRDDDSITLFEIKLTEKPFIIDKAYANNLRNKIEVFSKITKTNKQLFLVIIASGGIKTTVYSEELVNHIVTLDDLFKEE